MLQQARLFPDVLITLFLPQVFFIEVRPENRLCLSGVVPTCLGVAYGQYMPVHPYFMCVSLRIRTQKWHRENPDLGQMLPTLVSGWGGWWLFLAGWGDDQCLWRCMAPSLWGSLHVDGGDSGHEAALKEAVRVRWLVVTIQSASEKMLAETLGTRWDWSLTRTLPRAWLCGKGQRTEKKTKNICFTNHRQAVNWSTRTNTMVQ